jgi:hypothetical protein
MYFHVAVQMAQDYFQTQACPCPRCGRSARELFWLGVSTPDQTWEDGHGLIGWMTICQECRVQVSYIPDPDVTAVEAENRRLIRESKVRAEDGGDDNQGGADA